jgi:mono/diheme cytochrome c family protein
MMGAGVSQRLGAIGLGAAFFLFTTTGALAEPDAARLVAGRALFTQGAKPPCAVCHTLAHAEAGGAVGPVLDELKPDAARVAKAMRNGIGAMPSYSAVLSAEQIDTLAFYVSSVSGR